MGIKVNLLNDFDAEATEIGESNPSGSLLMPQRVNLHEVRLRRSKQIAKQNSKVEHKAHVTYGARAKQLLEMVALICTVNTYQLPSHRESQDHPSFTALLLCRIDEANEHCDRTLNESHFVSLLTDMSLNDVFTYHQAQKQDDWIQFVEAMEKEVEDHEGHGHWILVPCSTIPSGNKPINSLMALVAYVRPHKNRAT